MRIDYSKYSGVRIMSVTPLETLYHGVYFRSKTEARFAVFLDCLGVKWEYEPQGFDLGNGLKYLPDFKIYNVEIWDENRDKCNYDTYEPKMLDHIWVEVKGVWKDDKPGELSDYDYAKINSFVFDKSGSVINPLWVAGNCYTLNPMNKYDFLSCSDHGSQNLINTFRTITGDNKDLYPICPQYGKLVLAITDCHYPVPCCDWFVDGNDVYGIFCDNVLNALEEASRYKFDHGGQYKQASCEIHDHIASWSDFMVRSTRNCVCGMLEDIIEAGYDTLVDEILQKYSVKAVDDVPYCNTDITHHIYKDACKIVDDYGVILSER